MSARYQSYDAVSDFRKQWNAMLREDINTKDKPRLNKAVIERRNVILELFAAFINHTLAAIYPEKRIMAIYTLEAMKIMEAIRVRPINDRNQPIEPTLSDVLNLLKIDEHGEYIDVTLKAAIPRGLE